MDSSHPKGVFGSGSAGGFVLALALVLAFVAWPVPLGGQLVVDPAAPAANRPSLDVAPNNNVPLVYIAAPNAAGVSHNLFTEYNVGAEGLILDNLNNQWGQSALGGLVMSNPNLRGGPAASVILNEVTGTNRSNLLGPTEVFGQRAALVVANPNGIYMDGAGFINISRLTLTTGKPNLDPTTGALQSFTVDDGLIQVTGRGVDASRTDAFELISRVAEITADIHANDLAIIGGRNEVDYQTGAITPLADNGSTKPALAIDSSELGGMYAGRIRVISTEDGVGVNMSGVTQASASDLFAQAAGKVTVRRAAVNRRAEIRAREVQIEEMLHAREQLVLDATNEVVVDAAAVLASAGDGAIVAGSLQVGAGGVVAAGLNTDGTLNAGTTLGIVADTDIANQGTIISGGDLGLLAQTASAPGQLAAGGDMSLTLTSGGLEHTGNIAVLGNLSLDLAGAFTNSADLEAGGHLTLSAASVANDAVLEAGGNAALSTTGDIANTSELKAAGDLYLQGTKLTNTGASALIAAGGFLDTALSAGAGGNGNATNDEGTLYGGSGLGLLADGDILNSYGNILSGGNIDIANTSLGRANSFTNSSATVQSWGGNINILAESITNKREIFNLTIATSNGWAIVPILGSPGLPNVVAGTYLGTWVVDVPDPSVSIILHRYIEYKSRDEVQATSSSSIEASANIFLDGGSIINAHSSISAGADIDILGGTLLNQGDVRLVRGTVNHDALLSNGSWIRINHQDPYTHSGEYFNADNTWRSPISGTTDYGYVLSYYHGLIEAGGIINGSTSATSQSIGPFNYRTRYMSLLPSSVATASSGATVAPPTASSQDFGVAPALDPLGALGSLGSVFTPGSNVDYLYESSVPYVDQGIWLGSDYFFERVPISGQNQPETFARRLGDSFFETQYVLKQVEQQAGRRQIGTTPESDYETMQRLMDNALQAQDDLGLTPGVALTAEQFNNLERDLVWFEETVVNGETVMAPKVYLSAATLANNPGRSAAILGMEGVKLTTEGDLVNSGTISSGGSLALNSGGDLINRGGQLESEGDMGLSATGSVVNETAKTRIQRNFSYP